MSVGVEAVTVRMYRNLLGDCFLIRIHEEGGAARHILIDCGLLQSLENASARMQAVAADILATCKGRLDVVVVTHEHWDHLSGFAQAKDLLLDPERLTIGALWLAWTEDPGDAQANALRARFERRSMALSAFAAAGGESGGGSELLDGLERFIGPRDLPGNAFGAAPTGRLTGRRILDELKALAGEARTRYLEPGTVVQTPGEAALEVAVLAPPRNQQRLFKDLPSGGAAKETWLDEEILGQAAGDSPFAAKYSAGLDRETVRRDGAKAAPGSPLRLLHDRYFADRDPEEGRAQAYRRIDGVHAETAARLALKLDSDTNNSSLVLAFRLPDDGFLLFAADAQVGNWLSWHDQDYGFADGRLSAVDILGRTRLYKVGHHGSHNATLKGEGLERMTRDDLVAMISTVEEEAGRQGRRKSAPDRPGWQMPDKNVLDALLERCAGRVVIGDRRWRDGHDEARFGGQQAFAAILDEDEELYVDVRIFGGERPPPPAEETKDDARTRSRKGPRPRRQAGHSAAAGRAGSA